jgi:GTPase SAR1 family protein
MDKAIEYRSKCKHFRTLIVGRANAGKTTLLKKVCNSIEDPEIFSPSGEKVVESAAFEHRLFDRLNQLQLDPAVVQESSEV